MLPGNGSFIFDSFSLDTLVAGETNRHVLNKPDLKSKDGGAST